MDCENELSFAPNSAVGASLASAAFGRMLAWKSGPPFWRQRMVYRATKLLIELDSFDEEDLSVGKLSLCTHVTANSNFNTISEATRSFLTKSIALGLSNLTTISRSGIDKVQRSILLELLVSSTIKLFCESPSAMKSFATTLVTSFLRILKDQSVREGCHVLALQGLCISATHVPERKRSQTKAAVTAITVDMLDSPSVFVRQAAVHTRNVWFLVDE
mmetsp:Transcript_25110/g.42786  ORF Transcript_25110/g.42786 Transcript_25110/m.42786 type:complete len:217 (-) Transcript_25110:34-684(-)